MVNLVPNFLRKIWDIWNIRGLVLTSFALQVCLLLFAPLRKCTNKSIVTWFIWSAYLLTDYVATFCVSLIFDQRDHFSDNSVNSYILVFWATFLLSHLGGLDTITAFALEDNELWSRHLLGLVFQVGAIVYVFFLTIPGNTLWIPTTLLFVAGMIKYIERIVSLFLVSKNTLRKSCKDSDLEQEIPHSSDLVRQNVREYLDTVEETNMIDVATVTEISYDYDYEGDVKLLQHGFSNFNIFKRLFVDKTLDFKIVCEPLRTFFLRLDVDDALRLIEIELNFMYEFFFTKASMLWNKVGCLLRVVSIISTLAALLMFVTDKKHGFNKLEIEVTYVLLFGAVALDTMLLLRLIFSDRSIITFSQGQSSEAPETISSPQRQSSQALETISQAPETISSSRRQSFQALEKFITKLANNLKANLSKVVFTPFLKFSVPKWSKCKKEPYTKFYSLSTSLLFCKWSGKISGHDFIISCVHKTKEGKLNIGGQCRAEVKFLKKIAHQVIDYFGAEELVETWLYKANNPFLKELWEFIFEQLKNKSEVAGNNKGIVDGICEATGEWILQREEMIQQKKDELMPYVNFDEVGSFGERIMIWHIATGLCYYAYSENDLNCFDIKHRCVSKLLSDYMMYLLVMEPNVISASAGIDRGTIEDTILLVKRNVVAACDVVSDGLVIQNQVGFAQLACETMINALSGNALDQKNKLLIHACNLADKLSAMLPESWEMVAKIWVEMLSYVALNTKPDMHVQQLSKGGQLISLVWLLMIHMGLGGHQLQKIGRFLALPHNPSEPTASSEPTAWRSRSI